MSRQSVAREKLQLLGEDPSECILEFYCDTHNLIPLALDQEMLTSNQKQKWKNAASKAACRDAYRHVFNSR